MWFQSDTITCNMEQCGFTISCSFQLFTSWKVMSARLSPFIPLTILPVLSVWADSSKILITCSQVQVWSEQGMKGWNHLWDLISHPLGEIVSILNRLVCAFPLLQSHCLLFLLLHQWTNIGKNYHHLVQDLNEYLHAADENGSEGLDLLKMLSKTFPLARVQKILLATFHVVRHLVQ